MTDGERLYTGWNMADFEEAIANPDWKLGLVARQALEHAADDSARGDEAFHGSVLRGFDAAMQARDHGTAYQFAVTLDRLGLAEECGPRIVAAGVPLAAEHHAKAQAAYADRSWRRTSDKAVWAASYYSDVIEEGHPEYIGHFVAAAQLMCEARSRDGGGIITGTEGFEDWLIKRCDDLGIGGAADMIVVAYSQDMARSVAFAASGNTEAHVHSWVWAHNAVRTMEKYGAQGLGGLRHYLAMQSVETELELEKPELAGMNLRIVAESLSPDEYERYHEAMLERDLLELLEGATALRTDPAMRFFDHDTQPYFCYWRAAHVATELSVYQTHMRHIVDECLDRIPDVVPVHDDTYEELTWQFYASSGQRVENESALNDFVGRLYDKAYDRFEQVLRAEDAAEAEWRCLDTVKALYHCLGVQHEHGDQTAASRLEAICKRAIEYICTLPDQEQVAYAVKEIEAMRLRPGLG